MELDYKLIGAKIRAARLKTDITQERLAEIVGISTTHMSNIEQGKTMPSLKILVNVANVLSMSIDDIIHESKSPSQIEADIIKLLDDCTEYELCVLKELLISAKSALRNNEHLRQ